MNYADFATIAKPSEAPRYDQILELQSKVRATPNWVGLSSRDCNGKPCNDDLSKLPLNLRKYWTQKSKHLGGSEVYPVWEKLSMQLYQKYSVPNQDPADLLVRGVVIRRVRASASASHSTFSGSNLLDAPVVCEMQLRSKCLCCKYDSKLNHVFLQVCLWRM